MKLVFHSDPGHGWLEVPVSLLMSLGINDKISGYSYLHQGKAFLEEDCDAQVFFAAAEKAGIELEIEDRYVNHEHSIRHYHSYSC